MPTPEWVTDRPAPVPTLMPQHWYVMCDDGSMGPLTDPQTAVATLREIAALGACRLPHRIERD